MLETFFFNWSLTLFFDCPVLVESTEGDPAPSKTWSTFVFLENRAPYELAGHIGEGAGWEVRRFRFQSGGKVMVNEEWMPCSVETSRVWVLCMHGL
jgi:hypothetical protein